MLYRSRYSQKGARLPQAPEVLPFRFREFFITSDSDLDFVREKLQQILQEDIGEQMLRRVTLYRNILRETPVDDVDVPGLLKPFMIRWRKR